MKILIGVSLGAAIGFLIGYFGSCTTGNCPITKNPYISTAIGALFGYLISSGRM